MPIRPFSLCTRCWTLRPGCRCTAEAIAKLGGWVAMLLLLSATIALVVWRTACWGSEQLAQVEAIRGVEVRP